MPESLMIGVSGVRGIIGETLTPELITRFAAAFGTYLGGGKVMVARDTRASGAMVKHSVFAGLMSTGCHIVDLDICPTPTAALMIAESDAAGGVVISGSHNPEQWNALKFFGEGGVLLNEAQGRRLLDLYYQGVFRQAKWNELKPDVREDTACKHHIEKILDIVDVKFVKKAKFKVVLDSCNGAGSVITPELLKKLGCKVTPLHCDANGGFPHDPEPIFVNLEELRDGVVEKKAHVGFAQDADADRVGIVDERGQFLGEERSLALVARHVLADRQGTVVTNISTSRMVEDIARAFGSKVVKTKVGEINVVERLKQEHGILGGEGNGGIIDPRVHYARDSLTGMALLLEHFARSQKPVSRLARELPYYDSVKHTLECSRDLAWDILSRISEKYQHEQLDFTDGVRIDRSDSWTHVRASGTEPSLRIITEARSRAYAEAINREFVQFALEHGAKLMQ